MKKGILFIFLVLSIISVGAQEDPYVSIEIPAQNMLKFNRFMINPTFSTVRENKSYINAFHRNQWIQYDEAFNTYLLSYSGRVGDRTGMGLSLYGQNFGTISNFGVLANYAYGFRLAENTVFTFGVNLSYYKSGFDQNQSITTEPDPRLAELQGNSLISVQPGFNLAIGNFDLGFYAENLFDYNLKTSKSLTNFSEKTFSGHLQYTKQLKNSDGLMQNGRLMVLARGRKQPERDVNLSGSLILDLPRLGWIQGGYDDYYGAAVGLGFNLSKRISIGYTFERGVSGSTVNLGPTHEISFAYSFQPTLTDKMVFEDDPLDSDQDIDDQTVVDTDDKSLDGNDNEIQDSKADDFSKARKEDYKGFSKKQRAILLQRDAEIEALKKNVAENNMLIDEILFRQDSLEKARVKDEERRFAQLMQLIKRSANNQVGNTENQVVSAKETGKISETKTQDKQLLNTVNQSIKSKSYTNKTFNDELKKNNIRGAKLNNLNGVQSGYYIIVNVFSTDKFFNKFMDKLNDKNLDPKHFLNSKNNWKYVYLKRFDTWQEAVATYKSNLNGSYKDDKWIMNVDNGDGDADYAYNQIKTSTQKVVTSDNLTQKSNPSSAIADTQNSPEEQKLIPEVNNDGAQEPKSTVASKRLQTAFVKPTPNAPDAKGNTSKENSPNNNVAFKNELKKNHIRNATMNNLKGVQSGYYIIANVFATDKFFGKFMDSLSAKGMKHDYFVNHKNNWKYVYLKRYDTWQEAIVAYKSKLNGSYNGDIWIMNVDNGDADANYAYGSTSEKTVKKEKEPKILTNKINNTDEGYYVIVNVFSTPSNADKFLKSLTDKGIEANYFIDPKNNYRYVYVKKTNTLNNALYSYHTNLNSQYFDDMWIMHLTKL